MTTHVTKSWMENGKLVVQVIPQKQIYKRPWVGLTDADMTECIVQTCNTDDGTGDTRDLIRAVEAKLKEKNGA